MMIPFRKHALMISLLGLFFCGLLSANDNKMVMSPIVDLVLNQQTRLEKTLDAYQDPNSSHIFIAAHRGGKEFDDEEGIPGNSIANIDNSLGKGFDLYESDIEILYDGTLVVFHDNFFEGLTNSEVTDDFLDNPTATLAYAKSLFLTYDNNGVSSERIPTLEEFLSAIKGKMMVKFDLKSGTFGSSVVQRILDTAVNTGTTEQVLIRAGSNVLDIANDNGYDTEMIMRRFGSDPAPTVTDINDLVANYDVRAISIPALGDATSAIVQAANAAGLVVEVHESQCSSSLPPMDFDECVEQRETDWQTAIDLGVRQFHSFKPSLLKAYLKENSYREF